MTDKDCQILLDIRCHAVTGAVQNRSCYSRLTAAVNLTVSLLGCVPCPSIGLGAEKWPLALDNPITRLAERVGRCHWCCYSAPWGTKGT